MKTKRNINLKSHLKRKENNLRKTTILTSEECIQYSLHKLKLYYAVNDYKIGRFLILPKAIKLVEIPFVLDKAAAVPKLVVRY